MTKTILLVEDNHILRQTLKTFLENANYIVIDACKGSRMIEILEEHHVDIALLDLGLPDMNGMECVEAIRKKSQIPIIVISGCDDVDKKVECFEIGADDYIVKPVKSAELIARVKLNLRRHEILKNYIAENSSEQNITIGSWTLDHSRCDAFDEQNNPANLTIHEFKLLDKLAKKAGSALSRENLVEALRIDNYAPTPRAIDIKITRVRKKMGDSSTNPSLIKTIRGVGYMLNATT